MDEPSLEIKAISKIEKTTPTKNKFVIPTEKDGFTRWSFMDMVRMFGAEWGNYCN